MATIGTEGNGRKRILFCDSDGKRKTIRLGKATMKQAEAVKVRVEALISARQMRVAPDGEVLRWIESIPDELHAKLASVGLVQARNRQRLGRFLDDYFASLSVKLSTSTMYGHTRRCLLAFFGAERDVRSIQPAEAARWRQFLKDTEKLAESTVNRRVGVARQMFRKGVRWKLITENPFAEVKGGSCTNRERMYFVTREEAEKVLAACPDAQWKLLFALSRYGGLRCPSEHLALRWGDIDFEHNRIVVHSSKTEHHAGRDCRIIPLFPELRKPLLDVFAESPDGSEYVITKHRKPNANLRTQLYRIIRRAGVKPWPKLFQNLRSTRQTELANQFPIHVVCAWIGNSAAIARDHYLQVTDSHFASAVGSVEPAAQNPAQKAAEKVGNDENAAPATNEKSPENRSSPGHSDPCAAGKWALQDSNL